MEFSLKYVGKFPLWNQKNTNFSCTDHNICKKKFVNFTPRLSSRESSELLHLYKDVSVLKNYRILIYENWNKHLLNGLI